MSDAADRPHRVTQQTSPPSVMVRGQTRSIAPPRLRTLTRPDRKGPGPASRGQGAAGFGACPPTCGLQPAEVCQHHSPRPPVPRPYAGSGFLTGEHQVLGDARTRMPTSRASRVLVPTARRGDRRRQGRPGHQPGRSSVLATRNRNPSSESRSHSGAYWSPAGISL